MTVTWAVLWAAAGLAGNFDFPTPTQRRGYVGEWRTVMVPPTR